MGGRLGSGGRREAATACPEAASIWKTSRSGYWLHRHCRGCTCPPDEELAHSNLHLLTSGPDPPRPLHGSNSAGTC